MPIDGEEYLFYNTFPVNVGIIRGTTADPDGNITMEKEALTLEANAIAMAAHTRAASSSSRSNASPSAVRSIRARLKIPGILVDCVVVAEKPGVPHADVQRALQRRLRGRDQGAHVVDSGDGAFRTQDHRPPCSLRAKPDSISVNLGIGMPEGVSSVAAEEGVIDLDDATAEPYVIGGVPAGGLEFRRGHQR